MLEDIRAGKPDARRQFVERVYAELHRMASDRLRRESPSCSLQPTELVHEVFLRLLPNDVISKSPNRAYFFAAVARAMRASWWSTRATGTR